MSNALARMFERNVAAAILREPNTTEVARARRIIELFVETIGGFAFGTIAGQLARRAGAEHAARIRAAATTCSAPRLSVDPIRSIDSVLAHVPIILTAELRTALNVRLARAATDLGRLAAGHSETMFSELNKDSVFDDRLSIEISTGWSYACGVIERTLFELPDINPRARHLWHIWSSLAGRPIVETRRDPAHLDGYIALVG